MWRSHEEDEITGTSWLRQLAQTNNAGYTDRIMSTSIWLIEDRFASLIQSARDVIFTSHSAPLTDGPVLALIC